MLDLNKSTSYDRSVENNRNVLCVTDPETSMAQINVKIKVKIKWKFSLEFRLRFWNEIQKNSNKNYNSHVK